MGQMLLTAPGPAGPMNATKYGLYAMLPLLAAALLAGQAGDAAKSGGAPLSAYGSANSVVCGDRLCSEYPGGRAAFEAMMRGEQSPPDRGSSPQVGDEAMAVPSAMDGSMMEQDAMMEGAMTETTKKLTLARASVPAVIPMHMGHYDGEPVYYIVTDSSDQTHADTVTEMQGWRVELAPPLAQTPDSALSPVYFFTNGVEGDGVHGYQNQVFSSVPGQEGYSALTSHVHVTWSDGDEARELTSEAQIMQAVDDGAVILTDLPVVMNMPQIVWPGGQMQTVDRELTDDSPYGGGQVLDIDTDAMEATFIAHRGWGPDGRTIYYIVTDATPSGPAEAMGVVDAPSAAALVASPAAVDLYQFRNGLAGPGPLGFQPGIATGALGDENYSPMWRIFVVGWEDPSKAALLETVGDINAYRQSGQVSVEIARPMGSDHIVNCPFIDPFQ